MEIMNFDARNITIKEASKLIGKSEQFIRQGIIEGYLPIGVAFKRGNSSHYSYYISAKKLYDFTGYLHNPEYHHSSAGDNGSAATACNKAGGVTGNE